MHFHPAPKHSLVKPPIFQGCATAGMTNAQSVFPCNRHNDRAFANSKQHSASASHTAPDHMHRGDSLIVISLMHSHGDSGPSEQQAPIRGVLNGPTHVQGLWGPSVVQDVGLCCMAEPYRVHCLRKCQHAAPLQQCKWVSLMWALDAYTVLANVSIQHHCTQHSTSTR